MKKESRKGGIETEEGRGITLQKTEDIKIMMHETINPRELGQNMVEAQWDKRGRKGREKRHTSDLKGC